MGKEVKKGKDKISVVMPAYNAERTLERIYRDIPRKIIDEVILVDDGSQDKTVQLARRLGIKTIVHKKNKGYGGNQKTCYQNALEGGAGFVIMLHPDGQYDAKDLKKFVTAYKKGLGEVIIGSRFAGERNETPFYKAVSIRVITMLFNLVLGTRLTEANSGYRGYRSEVLEKIPWANNGDGYIFDPQALIQCRHFGFRIAEVPVSKVYNKEAISPDFRKSVEHGIENIKLLAQYLLHKSGLRQAGFLTEAA